MAIVIGAVSGILAGMGLGGGSLLIPALILFLNTSQKGAQAANMIGFVPAAAVSIIAHRKNKLLDFKKIYIVALSGVIASVVFASVSVRVDDLLLKKIFAVFLTVMGVYEILNRRE